MSTKYIHNVSGGTKTYRGVPIADTAFYEIQTANLIWYQTSEDIMTDLVSDDIRLSADGVTDYSISAVSNISYLLNTESGPVDAEGATIIHQKAFAYAGSYRFRGTGVTTTITAGTTQNVDYKLTEDKYINGLEFIVKDHVFGDKADFQVVDVDNILGYGAGTVLDEFGSDWYIAEDSQRQGPYILPFHASVIKDLYIRIKYYSNGATNVTLNINYFLHKKS